MKKVEANDEEAEKIINECVVCGEERHSGGNAVQCFEMCAKEVS
jgi:ribosomal protein S14